MSIRYAYAPTSCAVNSTAADINIITNATATDATIAYVTVDISDVAISVGSAATATNTAAAAVSVTAVRTGRWRLVLQMPARSW